MKNIGFLAFHASIIPFDCSYNAMTKLLKALQSVSIW